MPEVARKRVLLLGLEEGTVWQLTKALAPWEDRWEVHCARNVEIAQRIAQDLGDPGAFDVVLLDGWEESWRGGYLLGWEAFLGLGSGKWVILGEGMPLEGVLDPRIRAQAIFLPKPIEPRALPPLLLGLLEDGSDGPSPEGEGRTGAVEEGQPEGLDRVQRVAGERYASPEPPRAPAEDRGVPASAGGMGEGGRIPPGSGARGFHRCVDEGFACLKRGDYAGAREHWLRALESSPGNPRLLRNLTRLERLLENEPSH